MCNRHIKYVMLIHIGVTTFPYQTPLHQYSNLIYESQLQNTNTNSQSQTTIVVLEAPTSFDALPNMLHNYVIQFFTNNRPGCLSASVKFNYNITFSSSSQISLEGVELMQLREPLEVKKCVNNTRSCWLSIVINLHVVSISGVDFIFLCTLVKMDLFFPRIYHMYLCSWKIWGIYHSMYEGMYMY